MMFKEKIDPFKKAFGQAYRAIFVDLREWMSWKLNSESARSLKMITRLKDSHKGEKAVILFNGPSLLETDFSLLKDVFTFGLNKINLIFEEKNFTPSMVVAFDQILNTQNKEFLNNSKNVLKILNYKSLKDLNNKGDDFIYLFHTPDPSFCYDPSAVVANRGSTPYITFQIAYYMGFEEIAIVGADHNFPDLKPLQKIKNEEEDKFHFHKDYHKKGEVNQYPDKINLDMIFRDAGLAFEEKGRKIYNATPGGKLEIFERTTLTDFLNKK